MVAERHGYLDRIESKSDETAKIASKISLSVMSGR